MIDYVGQKMFVSMTIPVVSVLMTIEHTGWSEPRLTKTWATPASHKASKKAKDAVYMLSVGSVLSTQCNLDFLTWIVLSRLAVRRCIADTHVCDLSNVCEEGCRVLGGEKDV